MRSAFVADVLRGSGHSHPSVRLRVHGESMLPTLWPGDVVEIESCSLEHVRPGEIVLALRDGRFFLHRLVERNFATSSQPDGFLLRGDSVPKPDPPFPPEALVGRLARRADERRDASRFGVTWSRAVGVLLCHCGVARRLALKLHSRRKTSARALRNPEGTVELGDL
jgi:hypothetical protein